MSALIKTVKRYVAKNNDGWSMEFAGHLDDAEVIEDRLEVLEEALSKINKRLYPVENWEAEIETVMNIKGVARGERVWALEKRIEKWSDEVTLRLVKLEQALKPGDDVEGLFSKRVFDLEERMEKLSPLMDKFDDQIVAMVKGVETIAKAAQELDAFTTENRRRLEDCEAASRGYGTVLRQHGNQLQSARDMIEELCAAFRDLERRDLFPASPSYNPFPVLLCRTFGCYKLGGHKGPCDSRSRT